jgi:uncharacterized protein YkwD
MLMLACALPAWPAPPPVQAPAQPPQRMADAVNRSRADAGCAPVRLSAALTRAAEAHSIHMARHRHLSHTGAGSSTPAERARDAGFRTRQTAEVIASGPRTPQAAVSMWLDSAPHRRALLTCGFTHVGVGEAGGGGGPWWTLDLARAAGRRAGQAR